LPTNFASKYSFFLKISHRLKQLIMRLCDDFVGVNAIVVTGGTGESRIEYIREFFKDMDVEVIAGNENDPTLPYTLSNVLGYYMRAYNKLSKGK